MNNKWIKHKKDYDKYCIDCNLNICFKCFKEHRSHNTIYFGDLIINDEININKLKENIDNFNFWSLILYDNKGYSIKKT